MAKCPILFLMLASWAGLAALTWSEGKMPDTLDYSLVEHPVFTALLEPGLKEPVLDDEEIDVILGDNADKGQDAILGDGISGEGSPDNQKGGLDTGIPGNGGKASDSVGGKDDLGTLPGKADSGDGTETGQVGITEFKTYKKKKTDSRYYSDPGMKALTTDFPYGNVGKSYFDDAVFIGDSRTVGMQDYSGLDNAQFFAKTGMNVYEVLEDKFLADPKTGKEVSVAHMLKNYKYGKIYFMVGINELGTGNTGTFQKAYARVLRKFRKWQPDAVIYVQGIIPVSKAKASGDEIFNNININDKNVAIAQLADGKDIFYLDVSKKLTDKKGYLKANYTFDDVHMYAQYYQLWTDYLMEHAVVR